MVNFVIVYIVCVFVSLIIAFFAFYDLFLFSLAIIFLSYLLLLA